MEALSNLYNVRPMTQADQEADAASMRALLSVSPSYTVERCEHHSCELTALWIFANGKQVASVTAQDTGSKWKWRAQKMHRGGPITDLPFETLSEAAAYVLRCC